MARRTLTPDGSFCSHCGGAIEPVAVRCLACGEPIEGDAQGTKCPQCGRVVDEQETKCPTCGTTLPRRDAASEKDVLEKIIAFREQNRSEAAGLDREPTAMPEESEAALLAELESLWKLSEPFEQVVTARRQRLELMDRLIASARRRVRELEESAMPAEVREREELKKQLQQVLLERDEILKIEYGITEMERIYRNIITMQQKELRAKEESLRARLEGFRREIGLRDQERAAIAAKEKELQEREDSLRARLDEISHRERELQDVAPQERGSSQTQPEGPSVSKEQWLAAQKEVQEALFKLRGVDGEINLEPSATAIRDLRLRINELEESMEKVMEEKNRLEGEMSTLREAETETRDVMKVIDELLANLADEHVRKFARSESFRRYEKLLERLGL